MARPKDDNSSAGCPLPQRPELAGITRIALQPDPLLADYRADYRATLRYAEQQARMTDAYDRRAP